MAAEEAVVEGFFEGTEKRIEIDFTSRGCENLSGSSGDLRSLPEEFWQEVIKLCNTQSLQRKVTNEFTSYLLAESSLLVYPKKVIVKTCGNTVPLGCIETIFQKVREVGLQPEWFLYSRKNFLQPSSQPEDHQSLDIESAKCQKACRGCGGLYVLGPLTGDHWLVYDAELVDTDCSQRGDFTVDVMMYDLPEDVRKHFLTKELGEGREAAEAMAKNSGLAQIATNLEAEVDDYGFTPCGYSVNWHAGNCYGIAHVSPEEHCSYASFETNLGASPSKPGEESQYIGEHMTSLISQVLEVFRPGKFTMTLFADLGAAQPLGNAPFNAATKDYKRLTVSSSHFPNDYVATVANYTRKKSGSDGSVGP